MALSSHWRHLVVLATVVGSLLLMLSLQPFGQDPAYHRFADRRVFFGIPNFSDVASNLAFLAVGIAGLRTCLTLHLGSARNAWTALFTGVVLVGAGSAYYHWNPSNATLVWDRLPMTIGFMGLFAALLGEYVSTRLGAAILFPVLLFGLFSVLYGYWADDLRLYYWVQLIPLLMIPLVIVLYRDRAAYSHQWLLLAALGGYALAKLAEVYDAEIFILTKGLLSGHTAKHLLSAAGCFAIVRMLQSRTSSAP